MFLLKNFNLNYFKLFFIFFIFINCFFYFIFYLKEDFVCSLQNKIYVFANNSDNVINQVNEINGFLDRWPFILLKSKIEKLVDSFFTEEVILMIFFSIFIFFCSTLWFFNKTFSTFIMSISIWSFFYLRKLWENTETGSVFLNIFDKLILIKPFSILEKESILFSIFEKYSISKNVLSNKDMLILFKKPEFLNLSKQDFSEALENYVFLNLLNNGNSAKDNVSQISSILDSKIAFLFTDVGKSFLNYSFSFSYFLWENKFSIFLFCSFSYFISQKINFYALFENFCSFLNSRKDNSLVLAESSAEITRNSGEISRDLLTRTSILKTNIDDFRNSVVDFMVKQDQVNKINLREMEVITTKVNLLEGIIVMQHSDILEEAKKEASEQISSNFSKKAISFVQTISSDLN
jgi:hypothetical protein